MTAMSVMTALFEGVTSHDDDDDDDGDDEYDEFTFRRCYGIVRTKSEGVVPLNRLSQIFSPGLYIKSL